MLVFVIKPARSEIDPTTPTQLELPACFTLLSLYISPLGVSPGRMYINIFHLTDASLKIIFILQFFHYIYNSLQYNSAWTRNYPTNYEWIFSFISFISRWKTLAEGSSKFFSRGIFLCYFLSPDADIYHTYCIYRIILLTTLYFHASCFSLGLSTKNRYIRVSFIH